MNNLTGLRFYVNEDLNLVVDDLRGKAVKHKVISLNTFCKLVEKTVDIEDVCTGILPDKCISYIEKYDGEKVLVLDYGKFMADIIYEDTRYDNFPLPRLLFSFSLNKEGRIKKVRVAVAELGKLRKTTGIFWYPFSNVSDFDMCTGSNELPKIKELRQLESMPYYIFSMPDNNDHYEPEKNKT